MATRSEPATRRRHFSLDLPTYFAGVLVGVSVAMPDRHWWIFAVIGLAMLVAVSFRKEPLAQK